MKRIFYLVCVTLLGFTFSLQAQETQTITLKDGSHIKGKLVGVDGGSYTIRTSAMGDIKINSTQVASITNGDVPAAVPPSTAPLADNSFNQQVQAAQNRLMGDPMMMMKVQEMVQDPEMMKLLTDPSITQAVMARDAKALQSNPKAQELLNNPKMKALIEQMQSNSSN